MLARVFSSMITGIDASIVEVEVDMVYGLPMFTIVGLPDTAVRESKERVRAALRNAGFKFPSKKITINLAPANVRKEGALYDLPVAIAILCAEGIIDKERIRDFMLIGELSLDGHIKPVRGALSMAIAAREKGFKGLLIPEENAAEAAMISGIDVYGVETLSRAIEFLNNRVEMKPQERKAEEIFPGLTSYDEDLQEVKGQEYAKRALEVAAAGGHNLLMIGPPGSGKTMLARRLPTILPDITFHETIETTRIYSLTGGLNRDKPLLATRPFRSPHHTISYAGMAGGGHIPRPGEISLAHNGVLFLDEFPEYRRDVLEVLRQPIEEGQVTISRSGCTVTFPARFMLVAAMNPCPCGHYMDPGRECLCTPLQIQRYRNKISGPLLDRIDIHIEVPAIKYKDLSDARAGESSEEIRKRVMTAREIQRERFSGKEILCNAHMTSKSVKKHCVLKEDSHRLLEGAIGRLGLSARAYTRILKVSRTIADLDRCGEIGSIHVAEAIQYRSLDKAGGL